MVENAGMSITRRENMMRTDWEELVEKKAFKTLQNDRDLRKSICKLFETSFLAIENEKLPEVSLFSSFFCFFPSLFHFSLYRLSKDMEVSNPSLILQNPQLSN